MWATGCHRVACPRASGPASSPTTTRRCSATRAERLFRQRSRSPGGATAVARLQEVAWALRSEGRYAEALTRASEALHSAEGCDGRTRAAALCTLGQAHADVGDLAEAAGRYEEAL